MSSSYRSILKTTSITGITQIITILTKVINSKILAIVLGPAGVGTFGLLQTTIQLICTLFGFGLSFSAVRNVAEAKSQNNEIEISQVVKSLKLWLYITGFLGTIFTFTFSPWLSQITFGDENYTIAFRITAIVILVTQISNGQFAILQGYRLIKELSLARVVSSILGILITIPMFYFYRESAFPYVILLLSISALWRSWYFTNKIPMAKIDLSISKLFSEGKSLFSLGMIGLTTALATELSGYLVRIFIQRNDTLAGVGIYQAAWTISVGYLQLIFNAMGTDYYPRLVETIQNKNSVNKIIEEQGNIALWISTPLIVSLIVLSPLTIKLLYTKEFYNAAEMIKWMMPGIFFKIILFPIGYLLPVLKKNKTFLLNQILWQILFLCQIYFLWPYVGLNSIGYSFSITYFIHLTYTFAIVKTYIKELKINLSLLYQIFESVLLITLTLIVTCIPMNEVTTVLLVTLILISIVRSLLKLKSILKSKLN